VTLAFRIASNWLLPAENGLPARVPGGKWLNDLRRRVGRHQPFAGVYDHPKPRKQRQTNRNYNRKFTFEGRKESQMLQSFAERLLLAKMRAEEGQALIEYALIVSLISVIAIVALQVTGHSVASMLDSISKSV
jgi:Flp pilus assembly pilin Flp